MRKANGTVRGLVLALVGVVAFGAMSADTALACPTCEPTVEACAVCSARGALLFKSGAKAESDAPNQGTSTAVNTIRLSVPAVGAGEDGEPPVWMIQLTFEGESFVRCFYKEVDGDAPLSTDPYWDDLINRDGY